MSKKYPALALPGVVAEQQRAEQEAQAQVIGLRNSLAGDIYSRLASDFIAGLADEKGEPGLGEFVNAPVDLAPVAAASLTAAMVFLEVAGMVRRVAPVDTVQ